VELHLACAWCIADHWEKQMQTSVSLDTLSRVAQPDILNRQLAEERPTIAHDHWHQVHSDCVEQT
jgi:hypothetical protein